MEGLLTGVSRTEDTFERAGAGGIIKSVSPRRKPGLLRRLALNISVASSSPVESSVCLTNGSQNKPKLQRAPSFSVMSSLTPSTYKSSPSSLLKWTPPLSPTQKSLRRSKVCDDENEQSAAMCVAMLRRPGLPPLQAITNLKGMVGAAPRAWILDFKIRGGRSCVKAKLNEIELLEKEVKSRRSLHGGVPKFLSRRRTTSVLARPTARDIVEAREELMQVLLFLHLRE